MQHAKELGSTTTVSHNFSPLHVHLPWNYWLINTIPIASVIAKAAITEGSEPVVKYKRILFSDVVVKRQRRVFFVGGNGILRIVKDKTMQGASRNNPSIDFFKTLTLFIQLLLELFYMQWEDFLYSFGEWA
ncbi:hypothetical protein O6P43_027884 [Quillaja saponaria]|uniref:Uncharacterized protein n=1 Tax=Quillaja saponaria TaxID=32244 RepID=A0AAD7L5E5_QUISA|nr:hypothetical protein O6P43_027884 [Quillaja saponaria]